MPDWTSCGLPLHAAGRHPRTTSEYEKMGEAAAIADSVTGRVVSSYALTLTNLVRARTPPAPGQVRQLVVGVSEALSYLPGASPLRGVLTELQVVKHYLHASENVTYLGDQDATKTAVLEALRCHSWLHMSCHGVQDPDDASRSAFMLHDQPLTLADLADLHLDETDLAYLAACQTATGDLWLLDEALHLAGALQLAGYRHVLATLWNISDAAARVMADITYTHLLYADPDHPSPADRPWSARAPFALHWGITRLRQNHPDVPSLWAPYVHFGP
ncbi:MAG: CHAT domain-containing protein [Streptosporangiaceae bacterium]